MSLPKLESFNGYNILVDVIVIVIYKASFALLLQSDCLSFQIKNERPEHLPEDDWDVCSNEAQDR